jgi:rubrerythrin
MTHHTSQTDTRDATYNLVSVLYHALQGAETYGMYIQDAEQSGSSELAQFFREVQQEEKRRADRAKELLGRQLGQSGGNTSNR